MTLLRGIGNRALVRLMNLIVWDAAHSDLCYGYNAFWRHCLAHMDVRL